jgi:SAM-dependent methyltransferase
MFRSSSEPESHRSAADLFERTAETYQRRADVREFNSTTFIFGRRKEIVLAFLERCQPPGRVLDFGMGPGVFARDVTARGFHFIGIDISPGMVERAKALGIENVSYRVGDLEALDEYEGRIDAVLAIGVIDYLEDPRHGLQKLARCVKPGGTLIVSFRNRMAAATVVRNQAKLFWRTLFPRLRWRRDTAFASAVHEHSFSARSHLRPWLQEIGFGDYEIRYFDLSPLFFNVSIPPRIWRLWFAIDRVVARPFTRWLCSAGVMSARRTGDVTPGRSAVSPEP